MKSITIQILVQGLSGKVDSIQLDGSHSGWLPLTQQSIDAFLGDFHNIKEQFFTLVKPMMEKAGLIFDSSLYTFKSQKMGAYEMDIWSFITFTDDNNEGKAVMMDYIKKTGLLPYSIITKPYG